jgi:hypothetical protein
MRRFHHLAICLLLLLSQLAALTQRSSYDPAAQKSSRQHDAFVEFALKQINPQNTDYGCKVDGARKLAVDVTVKTIDSWAVFIALSFLIVSFLMLLQQHQEGNRREIIAAGFLAQYHNAWLDARAQAGQAIRRYNELANTTSDAADADLQSQLPDTEMVRAVTGNSNLSQNARPFRASVAGSKNNGKENVSHRTDSEQPGRPRPRLNVEPEVDLIAQISALQQQLNASHEREKNLQKELSKVHRRAQAEPASTTVAS